MRRHAGVWLIAKGPGAAQRRILISLLASDYGSGGVSSLVIIRVTVAVQGAVGRSAVRELPSTSARLALRKPWLVQKYKLPSVTQLRAGPHKSLQYVTCTCVCYRTVCLVCRPPRFNAAECNIATISKAPSVADACLVQAMSSKD